MKLEFPHTITLRKWQNESLYCNLMNLSSLNYVCQWENESIYCNLMNLSSCAFRGDLFVCIFQVVCGYGSTLWLSDFIRPVESSVYRELVLLVETFTTRMEGQYTRNLNFFRNKLSQQ